MGLDTLKWQLIFDISHFFRKKYEKNRKKIFFNNQKRIKEVVYFK